MKLIFGGHWDSVPNGWMSMTEAEQDITKGLKFDDNSISAIFTEHVQEHITLIENISFLKEALRILKPTGVIRIAMPCIDKLIHLKNDELGKHYSDTQTKHYYPNEDLVLKELGLEGIKEEPIAFMLDSLFKGHNHRFLWTSELMKKVLEKIGFSEVYICEPGNTYIDSRNCLERIVRGVDEGILKEKFNLKKYDCETLVIEAKK